MSDLLQTGATWLAGMLKSYASQEITYTRGSNSVTLQASLGRSDFLAAEGYGAVTCWRSADFIIAAADLVLDGAATLPQRGDRIALGSDTYEVLDPGTGDVYRYCDPGQTLLRVHTKRI